MKVKVRFPIEFEEGEEVNPRVKDILILLAGGAALGAFIVFPGLPRLFKPVYQKRWQERDKGDWDKFNMWRLRSELKRLREQRDVEIVVEADLPVVKLTEKGKLKVLKYNLEDMELDKKGRWDKKWRLVIYDVPKEKKQASEAFRRMLRKLKLYRFQKSVYLTPFPCEEEIQFLRELFDLDDRVQIVTVQGIENEKVYRKYFGI